MTSQQYDDKLMFKTAWLYYMDGLTQSEIAHRLHLSAAKVSRLLQRARDHGMVEIRLNHPLLGGYTELERQIETRFGLEEAIVANTDTDRETTKHNVGKAGAYYLERLLHGAFLLGVGMGRTLTYMLPYLSRHKPGEGVIVTIGGGYSLPERDTSAYNVSWRMANLLGARLEQLFCPLVVESAEARDLLLQDRRLSAQLERAAACDVVVISIGDLTEPIPLVELGYCHITEIEQLRAAGAVGEVMSNFYNLDGQLVFTPLNQRSIALSLDQLCRVPVTIALSSGPEKVAAILGALRSGCLNVLITDFATAEAVLELDEATRTDGSAKTRR